MQGEAGGGGYCRGLWKAEWLKTDATTFFRIENALPPSRAASATGRGSIECSFARG